MDYKGEEMWSAVKKIKNKKAVGSDRVQVEVWNILGSLGIR